jgi:hypothetical protein
MIMMGKLRNLSVFGLLALAGAASGCFVESSPPPPPACFDGAVAAEWTLTANGQAVSCAGGDTVDIVVDGMTATFDCAAYAGVTPSVLGGANHNVSLALFNAAGAVLSQTQTMSLFVPCGTTQDIGNVELSVTP